MKVEPQQLKAFLLDAGLIQERQFSVALKKAEESRQRVGDVLISDGLISEEELIKLEAYILGIPFVNLEKEIVAPEVLKIIPEPIARADNIIAFRKNGQDLEVAMLDPEDLKTIDFIRKTADLRILPRLTTPESIKNILRQYQKTLEVEFGDIIKKEVGGIKTAVEEPFGAAQGEEGKDLQKVAEEVPVIKIVDTLLKHAILQRASDIHIEPAEKEVLVRYRIDGILRDAMTLPKVAASGIVARIKVLSNLKLDEHRLPQDGRFKVETEDYKYSVRVSILPVFDGEKIVLRLLHESARILSLEQLGFLPSALAVVKRNITKPH
ncbi:MAG: ATPase, T2SS/T4P/T4SS family, partial [Candidatus Wildermuthbacteria bacterium]|nr:ATPase, T2SS/T4P/T4SS family [Candidatus Wildermuthbacteria bacterium]